VALVRWPVLRCSLTGVERAEETVVEESPLTVSCDGRVVAALPTLGEHPVELALGFLRGEGVLSRRDDLRSWREATDHVFVETARGGSAPASPLLPVACDALYTVAAILGRMEDLEGGGTPGEPAPGTHAASLVDADKTLLLRRDVGRHNAVDMLSGRALLDGLDTRRLGLCTTGRVSAEILQKAVRMGVGVLSSRSAPTARALQLAQRYNVTVIGYARRGRMNVYTGLERIAAIGEERGGTFPP
jgi:FdhD protein